MDMDVGLGGLPKRRLDSGLDTGAIANNLPNPSLIDGPAKAVGMICISSRVLSGEDDFRGR